MHHYWYHCRCHYCRGEDLVCAAGKAGIGPFAKRLWDALTDIQYGRKEHPWSVVVPGAVASSTGGGAAGSGD